MSSVLDSRVSAAERLLKERGVTTRLGACCDVCADLDVPDGTPVAWSVGDPADVLWVNYTKDGSEVVSAFREAGLRAEWDGAFAVRVYLNY